MYQSGHKSGLGSGQARGSVSGLLEGPGGLHQLLRRLRGLGLVQETRLCA